MQLDLSEVSPHFDSRTQTGIEVSFPEANITENSESAVRGFYYNCRH